MVFAGGRISLSQPVALILASRVLSPPAGRGRPRALWAAPRPPGGASPIPPPPPRPCRGNCPAGGPAGKQGGARKNPLSTKQTPRDGKPRPCRQQRPSTRLKRTTR